jgi:hypothetical protein
MSFKSKGCGVSIAVATSFGGGYERKRIEQDRIFVLDRWCMAKVVIVCWQDIPSLVEVRDGAAVAKRQLSARFQELIDIVAMRKQLTGSDAYLEQWNRRKDGERSGDVNEIAAAVAAELESRYDEIRAAAIAQLKEV